MDTKSTVSKITDSSNKVEKQDAPHPAVIVYNIIQLVGWIIVYSFMILSFLKNNDLTLMQNCLEALRIMQTTQILEIVFAISGITNTGLFASFTQVGARILNTFWIYNIDTNYYIIVMTLVAWCTTEVIRSLFYLNKNSVVLSGMRYNGFIVLYPLGVTGELMAFEDYLTKYPDWYYIIRPTQLAFLIGFYFLYTYMWKQRGKFYKKQQEEDKDK